MDEKDREETTPEDEEARAMLVGVEEGNNETTIMIVLSRRLLIGLGISAIVCFVIVLSSLQQHQHRSSSYDPSQDALLEEHLRPAIDTTCMTNYNDLANKTNNPITSWQEFVYKTALLPQEDRCWWQPPNDDSRPCLCKSFMEPYPHNTSGGLGARWNKAFQRNLDLVVAHKYEIQPLDVVLLGDSMTEHWLGTDLGYRDIKWEGNRAVYQDLFTSSGTATNVVNGVALGIGGDRVPNLVYRLLHGEHVSSAKVFWLLIGINDHLGGEKCSADMIVAGNIHTVELLRALAPHSTIVVNSLLPFGPGNLDERPGWQFLQEINQKLACFASTVPNVEFFNATSLFLKDDNDQQVNMSLLSSDKFHPGAEGSKVWGNAIVKKVLELI